MLQQRLEQPYRILRDCAYLAKSIQKCVDQLNSHNIWEQELAVHELIIVMLTSMFPEEKRRTGAPAARNPEADRLDRIYTVLYNNFNKNITVSHVAEELYLSTRQVNRIIRQYFGMTWQELLADWRMKVALWILGKDRKMSVAEIAEFVGYNSVRGFRYAFLRTWNNPPQCYRGKQELVKELLGREYERIERLLMLRREER